MSHRLDRELRLLRAHALVTTPLLVVLALAAFRQGAQQRKARFTEVDVERINVVEPDGRLRMVISNRPRSIGPIYKGKPFGYPGGSRPGIIFFNDEGSENGGLGFSAGRRPDGTYRASSQLAFDQFEQDQILYLNYSDDNGQRRMGLHVVDRADVNIYDWVAKRDSINKLPNGPEKTAALAKLHVEARPRSPQTSEPTPSWLDGFDSDLSEALAELPAEQRQAVALRVVGDLPYRRIASRLDCTPAAARIRVSRGLTRLRARLEGNGV